ncbi:MAG: MmcQ/YjbR family DNA-binding protein [Amphritea sp.]
MDIKEVKKYCMSFAGAIEKDTGEPANLLSFSVHNKKFAYFKTSEPEKWRFSIRVTPERFLELTDQPGIKPARYMHRFYWVSIVSVRSVDENYLKELIDWSYVRAFHSLPKKIQKQIAS